MPVFRRIAAVKVPRQFPIQPLIDILCFLSSMTGSGLIGIIGSTIFYSFWWTSQSCYGSKSPESPRRADICELSNRASRNFKECLTIPFGIEGHSAAVFLPYAFADADVHLPFTRHPWWRDLGRGGRRILFPCGLCLLFLLASPLCHLPSLSVCLGSDGQSVVCVDEASNSTLAVSQRLGTGVPFTSKLSVIGPVRVLQEST